MPVGTWPMEADSAMEWLRGELRLEGDIFRNELEALIQTMGQRRADLVQKMERRCAEMVSSPTQKAKPQPEAVETKQIAVVASIDAPVDSNAVDAQVDADAGEDGNEEENAAAPTVSLKRAAHPADPDELNKPQWISQFPKGLSAFHYFQLVVCSINFEFFFGMVIVANAVALGFYRQYEGQRSAHLLNYRSAEHPDDIWGTNANSIFEALEWFFGAVIAVEVALKLIMLREKYFRVTWWNSFDVVIASIWVVDRVQVLSVSMNPTIIRLARIARIVRIIRVFRWLTLLDTLMLLVKSIVASVSVLVWAMLLMIVVISLVAITVSSLVEDFIRDDSQILFDRTEVFKMWGSYSRATETMFEITLANWGPATRLLMNTVDEKWAVFFLCYKMTIGFAVVQVIVSTFIQQTFKVASRDEDVMIREKQQAAQAMTKNVEKLFKILDESGDGLISKEEFDKVQTDARVRTWFSALEVDASEAPMIFELLDDGDGTITQEEFLNGVKAFKGFAKGTDMMLLSREVKRNFKLLTSVSEQVEAVQRSLRQTEAQVCV